MIAEKICLIATARSTIHDVLHFVNYHLNIGIDKIILFFDDPNDPAIAPLENYAAVWAVKCDDAYWESRGAERPLTIEQRQEINVNAGLRLAQQNDFGWIIHIDSDELLFLKDDIKAILSRHRGDVVMFSMKEAVPDKDHFRHRFEPSLFK
jgi:hypothetical protein